MIGFFNPVYGDGSIEVINHNPEIKWVSDLAKEIKKNPKPWNEQIQLFLSLNREYYDNSSLFNKCIKEDQYRQGKKRCIMFFAKVSFENTSPIGSVSTDTTSHLTLAQGRRSARGNRGRHRERPNVSFGEMIGKTNWSYISYASYVCYAVATSPLIKHYAPIIKRYILIGVFNPKTAIPSALIAVGTTVATLTCMFVSGYETDNKMNKMHDKIREGINELKKNDQKFIDEVEKLRNEVNELKKPIKE